LAIKCKAQNVYSEIGSTFFNFHIGPSKYLGDIGGHPEKILNKFYLDNSTFFFGASLQKYYARKGFLEIGISTGNLTASDNQIVFESKLDSEYQRYLRNLDFKTKITEANITAHIFPLSYLKNTRWNNTFIQPYVSLGIGIYNFNPMGSYFDKQLQETYWLALAPFHTEGQGYAEYPDRKEYNLTQLNIQYGGGLSTQIGHRTRISIGINGRKLFTDYLDDVSTTYIDPQVHNNNISLEEDAAYAIYFTNKSKLIDPFGGAGVGDIRGDSKNNDAYFNYYLKVGFKIKSKNSKTPNVYKFDDSEICF
jgi:hypothetical protein